MSGFDKMLISRGEVKSLRVEFEDGTERKVDFAELASQSEKRDPIVRRSELFIRGNNANLAHFLAGPNIDLGEVRTINCVQFGHRAEVQQVRLSKDGRTWIVKNALYIPCSNVVTFEPTAARLVELLYNGNALPVNADDVRFIGFSQEVRLPLI